MTRPGTCCQSTGFGKICGGGVEILRRWSVIFCCFGLELDISVKMGCYWLEAVTRRLLEGIFLGTFYWIFNKVSLFRNVSDSRLLLWKIRGFPKEIFKRPVKMFKFPQKIKEKSLIVKICKWRVWQNFQNVTRFHSENIIPREAWHYFPWKYLQTWRLSAKVLRCTLRQTCRAWFHSHFIRSMTSRLFDGPLSVIDTSLMIKLIFESFWPRMGRTFHGSNLRTN